MDAVFCPRVNTRVSKSVHFGPLRNSKKRTIERFFFPSLFDRLKRHRFDVRDVPDQRMARLAQLESFVSVLGVAGDLSHTIGGQAWREAEPQQGSQRSVDLQFTVYWYM